MSPLARVMSFSVVLGALWGWFASYLHFVPALFDSGFVRLSIAQWTAFLPLTLGKKFYWSASNAITHLKYGFNTFTTCTDELRVYRGLLGTHYGGCGDTQEMYASITVGIVLVSLLGMIFFRVRSRQRDSMTNAQE